MTDRLHTSSCSFGLDSDSGGMVLVPSMVQNCTSGLNRYCRPGRVSGVPGGSSEIAEDC